MGPFGPPVFLSFLLLFFCVSFYPRSPEVEPWVFRLTFFPSSSSPSPHHQLFVSIRYRKHQFSNWFDFPGNSSDSYLFLLLLFLFPGVFLSGELSIPVRRTVHSCPENCPQTPGSSVTLIALQNNPALGWIYNSLRSGSQIKASPGLDIKLAHYYCLRKTDSTVNTSQSSRTILQTVKFRFWLYKTYNLEITQINAKSQAPD